MKMMIRTGEMMTELQSDKLLAPDDNLCIIYLPQGLCMTTCPIKIAQGKRNFYSQMVSPFNYLVDLGRACTRSGNRQSELDQAQTRQIPICQKYR